MVNCCARSSKTKEDNQIKENPGNKWTLFYTHLNCSSSLIPKSKDLQKFIYGKCFSTNV